MKQPITVDPKTYTRIIKETYAEKQRGNVQSALTLAMCAGVDAGVLGLRIDECPFREPGMFDYELQWLWGRARAVLAAKIAETQTQQGNLI